MRNGIVGWHRRDRFFECGKVDRIDVVHENGSFVARCGCGFSGRGAGCEVWKYRRQLRGLCGLARGRGPSGRSCLLMDGTWRRVVLA